MYRGCSVGLVVPAYNEEGFVGSVLEGVPAYVDRIYVVDDASTDGTWREIVETVTRLDPASAPRVVADGSGTAPFDGGRDRPGSSTALRVDPADHAGDDRRFVPIRHDRNRGAGGAIKTGYRHALDDECAVVAVIDADGQMDPAILDRFLDPIVEGRAGYTKGNRLGSVSYREEMPRLRFLGNVLLTFLTRVASGYWRMTDPQNGYTAISNRALDAIGVEDMYEYYGYCNDLLVKLNVHDVRIMDVPMPAVYGDEESSIRYTEYVRNVSWMLLTNWLWRLKRKYVVHNFHPLALFYPVGVGTAGVGAAGVLYACWLLATSSDAVTAGMLSAILLAVGLLALLLAMTFDVLENEHLVVVPE